MQNTPVEEPAADRGVSELVGTALLVGLVVFASFIVIVMGSTPIGEAQEQNRKQSAETLLQEVDSRLATLSSSSDTPTVELELGDSLPRNLDTQQFGYVNLTVNHNGTCSFQQELQQIRYVGPQGEEIAYEAGGVFRGNQDSSFMLTSPDVVYRDGAIDITLVNFTGNVDQTVNTARLNVSASENRTRSVSQEVLQGECVRPDHVTLRVKSRFYQAWGAYFEQETESVAGATVTAVDGNQTAVVQLEQSALPRSVDDSRNSVINLSEDPMAAYMDDVQIPYHAPPLSAPPNEPLVVDKNAANNYTVFVEPLTEGGLDISELKQMNGTVGARRPVDVMLVLDESGSMDDDPDGDGNSKSREAQDAAMRFVGDLNKTTDRAGVVSYKSGSPGAYYRITDTGEYISQDFTMAGVNGSIEDIPDDPSGGTRADKGLELANSVIDLYSNESRRKIVILLTDGVNNGCDSESDDDDPFDCYNNRLALDMINESAAAGATVYTIGLGADSYLDEAFLKKAANLTGGSYYQAQNSDELDEVFSDIRNEFSNETFVARTPLTTNMSASGQVYAPQIAGDTDGVSNVTIGGQTYLNVNDPDAPSRFSHSFAIQDGGTITFNVTQYSCDEWQATPRTHTNNSTSFQVVRCAEINESDGTTIRPRLDNDNDDAYDEDPAYGASSGVNDDSDGEIDEDPIDGLMLDGDDASALIANDPAWWQTDINESLTAFPDVTINKTTGELHMNSNQALVIFDLPDGEETSNMLVLLYQVGLSESNARPEGVINIQISEVSID